MTAAGPVTVDGFTLEVDEAYSIVDGERTDDPNLAGGAAILRGRVGDVPVSTTVSAANLKQALGHALEVLLAERPEPGIRRVEITAYVDSETGGLHEIDRLTR